MANMRIAMTGATGFVGSATLGLALERGLAVNALTRRPQRPREGVTWVSGTLEDMGSLERLVADADAVIHIAGVVNARDRQGFLTGNAMGTMLLTDAMRLGGPKRIAHVSTLAAREPELSDYGWSKELAERHVMASGLDWTIVRPPAIYGPGDREMLDLFRMASRGFVMLPPGGHLSVIAVDDLARLLLDLCADRMDTVAQVYEVDDGRPGGWTHTDFARAIGQAVGRPDVRTIATPAWALRGAAYLDRLVRRDSAKLTPDRARYFCHDDWVANSDMRVPATTWSPAIDARTGLAETAAAYRRKGWL